MIVQVLEMSTLRSSVAAGLQDLLEKRAISRVDLRDMMRFVKNRHCRRAELSDFKDLFSKQAVVKSTRTVILPWKR